MPTVLVRFTIALAPVIINRHIVAQSAYYCCCGQLPTLNWFIAFAPIAAALATIFYTIVSILMWREIKRQTKQLGVSIEANKGIAAQQAAVAQDAANTALLSAQAVINSDRPWITFYFEFDRGYVFRGKNAGKTPAEVVSIAVGVECVSQLNQIGIEPRYEKETALIIRLVVHEADFVVMSAKDFRKHLQRRSAEKKMSIFCLRVIYKNPLSRVSPETIIPDYESRICYCFNPTDDAGCLPRVWGNENYNRYT